MREESRAQCIRLWSVSSMAARKAISAGWTLLVFCILKARKWYLSWCSFAKQGHIMLAFLMNWSLSHSFQWGFESTIDALFVSSIFRACLPLDDCKIIDFNANYFSQQNRYRCKYRWVVKNFLPKIIAYHNEKASLPLGGTMCQYHNLSSNYLLEINLHDRNLEKSYGWTVLVGKFMLIGLENDIKLSRTYDIWNLFTFLLSDIFV